MKTILVSLAHLSKVKDVIDAAAFLAGKCQAHIIGYYPVPGPTIAVLTHPGAYMPLDDTIQKMYEDKASIIKAEFEDRMKREGVQYEWRQERLINSDVAGSIIEHGRECDLVMVSKDERATSVPGTDINLAAEIVLGAGRPVLVVPSLDGKDSKLKKIIIGWNASRESCRAAFDSVSLLKQADDVHLTWVNPEKSIGNGGKLPGAELGAALARHDINVTTKGLSNRSKPGLALLTYARDQKADLLVLGAYGHSRLRERILGGTTEYVLKHADLPVLLSN